MNPFERDGAPESTLREDVWPEGRAIEPAVLRIVSGPEGLAPHAVELPPHTELVIGRDVSPPHLRLGDRRLSRAHARLVWDPRLGSHRFADLQSTNGSFVNGCRATSLLLTPGDVIRVGSTLLVYDEPPLMQELQATLGRLAATDLSIVLIGETGTGKEVHSRRIHEQSGASGPFVAVNCAGMPNHLVASEFFGHVKGAFSGASGARRGLFVEAEGGTLLLDEVGEMPVELQPVLLRTLQEKVVRAVGSDREVPINARVVAATNVPLQAKVEEGKFRADLYARLAQWVVHVPPLRDRRSTLFDLLETVCADEAVSLKPAPDVAETLLLWDWPFNVRELVTLVRSWGVMGGGNVQMSLRDLERLKPEAIEQVNRCRSGPRGEPQPVADRVTIFGDRGELQESLRRHGGNVAAVAREFGKPRAQIYRWMRRYGISRNES